MAGIRLGGHILALLTLWRRGARVAAADLGFVAQHSQHSICNGRHPPLASLVRCVRVGAHFLGATFVLVWHFFL